MKRNLVADVMKGIAILLVVLGHALQKNAPGVENNVLYNIIYSFHMPLFFAIAGYLMYKTIKGNRLEWIKDKAIYLLVPHVIFNLLYYFISSTGLVIFNDLTQKYSFLEWLKESLIFNIGEWFLGSLFTVFLLMLVIDYLERKSNPKVGRLFLITMVIIIIFIPSPGKNYFGLFEVQWYLPFCLMGYLVARYSQFATKHLWVVFILGLTCYPLVMIETNWSGGWIKNPLYNLMNYWENGILMTYIMRYPQAILGICLALVTAIGLSKLNFISGILAWLGRNTLGIYLFSLCFAGLGFESSWIKVVSAFILSLSISIGLVLLCNKLSILKILLGDFGYLKNLKAQLPSGNSKQ